MSWQHDEYLYTMVIYGIFCNRKLSILLQHSGRIITFGLLSKWCCESEANTTKP